MKFRPRCEIAKGRIDPVPVWDVIFLLMIFIVLTSPYVLQPGFKLDVPKVPFSPNMTFQNFVVTISHNNVMFFNNEPTTYDGLRQSLSRAAQQNRSAELIIKADRQVPYETVAKITSMAFEVGINGVNLATRPEVPAAGQAR